ncbi:MAG TPA: ATP-binding protein [Lacipirellulaceae bacterium]|nr:ATP-binding protein [Lacipirellulaceae bacterium]
MTAAFAAISLIAALTQSAIFFRTYESLLVEELDRRLLTAVIATGESLLPHWPTAPQDDLQAIVQRIGKSASLRLTVMAVDGKVLADSQLGSAVAVEGMENHRDRPEVIAAMRDGKGVSRRTSPTIGGVHKYLAMRWDINERPVGVIRASASIDGVESQLAMLNRRLAFCAGATALAAAAVAAWMAAQATGPLRRLTAASIALVHGRYDQPFSVALGEAGEFEIIARGLGQAAHRLAQSERQLRSTNQTQATVLEGMSESVIAVDREEHVLFANRSAGRLLSFRPDDVRGQPLLEAVRSHELREAVHRALRTECLATCELTWRVGAPRTFDVLATPLPGEPSPGVVLVLRDVSEVKRLEQMRHQFIANVSHELKTPLSSIRAYTETLLAGARNDPAHCQRFLMRIDEQAARLQDLILDMLSLARIESGQTSLEFMDVGVARVVRRCVADYESQAAARELTMENHVQDENLRVNADEEALRQILGNLVDNAVKYTQPGGRVSIHASPTGNMIEIAVLDSGIGIPVEHHARLFERFYRVDKARSRALGGTGLGLAIVKHLTQAMGGSVSVASEPQKGSTFTVRLPASNRF